MKTLTATEARKNIYKLLRETAETGKPIQISGKSNNAVLVSERDWSALQETVYLLSIPNMRESIREGLITPLEGTSNRLDW